jgi:hypothetical protein
MRIGLVESKKPKYRISNDEIQQAAERPVLWVLDVIPAEAGIQAFLALLDSRLRGSDGRTVFFSNLFIIRGLSCVKGISGS